MNSLNENSDTKIYVCYTEWDENVHGFVINFYEFVHFRGGWGGLAFSCQKTWGVAYTRGADYTSEYGMCGVGNEF